jgi:hypothetical protein
MILAQEVRMTSRIEWAFLLLCCLIPASCVESRVLTMNACDEADLDDASQRTSTPNVDVTPPRVSPVEDGR